MAKAKTKETVIVFLELTSEEALYLLSLLQNYLGSGAQEDLRDAEHRSNIFQSLYNLDI